MGCLCCQIHVSPVPFSHVADDLSRGRTDGKVFLLTASCHSLLMNSWLSWMSGLGMGLGRAAAAKYWVAEQCRANSQGKGSAAC